MNEAIEVFYIQFRFLLCAACDDVMRREMAACGIKRALAAVNLRINTKCREVIEARSAR